VAARAPEDCDRLFAEGLNAGDAAAVEALYESGATLLLETGEVATGPAIPGLHDAVVAMKPRVEMDVWRGVRGGEETDAERRRRADDLERQGDRGRAPPGGRHLEVRVRRPACARLTASASRAGLRLSPRRAGSSGRRSP
jgi:hypothetical protein